MWKTRFAFREELLQDRLWEVVANYFFENIYIPAAMADNVGYIRSASSIGFKHIKIYLLVHLIRQST